MTIHTSPTAVLALALSNPSATFVLTAGASSVQLGDTTYLAVAS